jgi:hypothetical protein
MIGIVNLIEPQADRGQVVDVLIRQRLCHDHAAGSIHREMQIAPRRARLRANRAPT